MISSSGLIEVRYTLREHTDDIPAPDYDPGSEQPTVEQLFIREAAKHLTKKQTQVWEYWNYDRLTQDEIAIKLGVSQQSISRCIRACEERIAKWCSENQNVYDVIRESMEKQGD